MAAIQPRDIALQNLTGMTPRCLQPGLFAPAPSTHMLAPPSASLPRCCCPACRQQQLGAGGARPLWQLQRAEPAGKRAQAAPGGAGTHKAGEGAAAGPRGGSRCCCCCCCCRCCLAGCACSSPAWIYGLHACVSAAADCWALPPQMPCRPAHHCLPGPPAWPDLPAEFDAGRELCLPARGCRLQRHARFQPNAEGPHAHHAAPRQQRVSQQSVSSLAAAFNCRAPVHALACMVPVVLLCRWLCSWPSHLFYSLPPPQYPGTPFLLLPPCSRGVFVLLKLIKLGSAPEVAFLGEQVRWQMLNKNSVPALLPGCPTVCLLP